MKLHIPKKLVYRKPIRQQKFKQKIYEDIGICNFIFNKRHRMCCTFVDSKNDCVDYDSQLKLLVMVRGLSGVQFRA